MNIFYTSYHPADCAANLDDKRVVKMCLETAQMLSTAWRLKYGQHASSAKMEFMYKVTHPNHPCNIWLREHHSNFAWLVVHHFRLLDQYSIRFMKVHDSAVIQQICFNFVDRNGLYWDEASEPPNCARNKSLSIDCTSFSSLTTECYQEYLRRRWKTDKRAPKWSIPKGAPTWAEV